MNCPYCHALSKLDRPATQRLTFYKPLFGRETEQTVDVCDEHGSYIRMSYHVKESSDLPQTQNDVSQWDYRRAVANLFYGPDGWIALPQEYKRISLLAMLAACHGQQRLADKITACLTIARYEGIDLSTDRLDKGR